MKHRIDVLVAVGAAVLFVATAMPPMQSRQDLRSRFGEPVSETFIVRPGISATATYGSTGQVVGWLISPHNTKTFSEYSATAVVDELVPASARGKPLGGSILNGPCMPDDCGGSASEYQNVAIYYHRGKAGLRDVVVQWKTERDGGR